MKHRDSTAPADRVNDDSTTTANPKDAWKKPEMKRKVSVRKVTLFSGSSSTIVSP